MYSGVGIGRDGNLEHEQNGFLWGLDNWIYSTYNAFRFRWTPHGFVREPTGANGAQWGVSQDDDGKIWWACGGCERGYVNFQIPDSVRRVQSAPIRPSRASRRCGRSPVCRTRRAAWAACACRSAC